MLRSFRYEKEHVKLALQSAISSIHFTLDIWTSPNAHALLGIVSHYTNEQGALKQSILAMKELRGEHSGENLASVFLKGKAFSTSVQRPYNQPISTILSL